MTPANIDTPDQVMACAIEGRLTKHALASLLSPESRRGFLDACGVIEKSYTDACAAANDPCLESGCSCVGDVCLQPLLLAGTEYHRRCGAEWAKLFAASGNRDASWKLTLAAYDVVWAAGGVPQAVFPTTFTELVRLTAGTAAEVA